MTKTDYKALPNVRIDEFTMMEFLEKFKELVLEGFEPDYMTLRTIGRNKLLTMVNPSYVEPEVTEEPEQAVTEVEEPISDPEPEVVEEASVEFSEEAVEAIGDKKELEDYGLQFGIDLKRNKSLENMKKDLIKAMKG